MKKLIGLIVIFLFSNYVAFCGQQELEQPQPFATNALLIFLDNQEKEIGAVSMVLSAALNQKAGPILVSTSLLQTIIQSPNLEELSRNKSLDSSAQEVVTFTLNEFTRTNQLLKQLIKKSSLTNIEKNKIIQTIKPKTLENLQPKTFTIKQIFTVLDKNKGLMGKIFDAVLKSSLSLNPNEWIIKQVNQHLLLLIPKQEFQKKQQQFNKIPDSQAFTKQELAWGLKIDHLQNVDSLTNFIKNYVAPDNVSYFIPSLPEIFITNQEYAQVNQQSNTKMQLPTWAIYMMGHGSPGYIVKLNINEFKSLLDFLEIKIKTTLFTYVSCFGAGANSEAVYKDLRSGIYKTYPFTIITAALIDASVSFSGEIFPLIDQNKIDPVQKKIQPLYFFNFVDFINYVTSNPYIDFAKAFSYIWITPTTKEFIKNFPQIKLAGIPWFNVADTQKSIVSLGKVMAQTRTQPLNITQFFKTQPMGILLQASIIPYPVTIDMTSMPALVSMLPGDATHIFKELNIPNITLQQFIDSFEPLKNVLHPKKYYFQTLTVKNDWAGMKGEPPTTSYHNVYVRLFNPSLDYAPHAGMAVFAIGKNKSIRWYDETKKRIVSASDDTLAQYNLSSNKWNKVTDNESKKIMKENLLIVKELVQKQEGNLPKQLGITPRKEKPQKLILPKEIPAIPGEEKPVEKKPIQSPVPTQQTIPATKTMEPAKPSPQKIPAIAPKPKPVAKPVSQKVPIGKVPAKKLSPAALKKQQQEKLKKQKLEQAKKQAALKKQQAEKKKILAKQKKAAIKGKKVISKKPVVQKKKSAVLKKKT